MVKVRDDLGAQSRGNGPAARMDASFIRRALELADIGAVRVALLHLTKDPDIRALPTAAQMDESQRNLLLDKAVGWLVANAAPREVVEPEEAELWDLMEFAAGQQMGELEFRARRDLPAFRPFPWMATWTDGRPDLPAGFRVAVIGSGFSGLAMAVQLTLLGIPYVVIDRQSEPGGTWSTHRYPDIRVDTASITYEYGFENSYPWTEYFAQGAEVRGYLDHVSRKFGIFENTLFQHELQSAIFDESRNEWILELKGPMRTEEIRASVIVNAVGTFANPKIPKFPGAEDFKGQIVHPSNWQADLDVTDRNVAIVGNGSTGVQMLSKIAEDAAQVFVYQRTPQWISPRNKYGKNLEEEILWLLENFPGYRNWWRFMSFAQLFDTHQLLLPDEEWRAQGGRVNRANDKIRDDLIAYIESETGGRQDLISRLIPDYAPMSRRPVVDNGWYKALTRSNVELVTEEIVRMNPRGIETRDGQTRDVDIVVTATGFEVAKYLWPAQYFGRRGSALHEVWSKDGPRAYLGMMVPQFPNMFILYGPNSQPVSGGTSLPSWYVIWSAYSAQCIVRMLEEGRSRVEVSDEAFARYNADLDREAQRLIVLDPAGAPEKNYYVNDFGRLQMNAPWYSPEFHRMCTRVDWKDLALS